MPRCLYCLTMFFSPTDDAPMGSSCECGENVCEDDQRAAFYADKSNYEPTEDELEERRSLKRFMAEGRDE